MNLKEIEYIQQLEKENEKLKKRVEQLEKMMYNETIDSYYDYIGEYE